MQDFNSRNPRKRAAHRYEPISRRQDRAIASRTRRVQADSQAIS